MKIYLLFCYLVTQVISVCDANCVNCPPISTNTGRFGSSTSFQDLGKYLNWICTSCNNSLFLDQKTGICYQRCPLGYNQSNIAGKNVCTKCNVGCSACTANGNCTACYTSGYFLYNNNCSLGCTNGYQKNYVTHICDCPPGFFPNAGNTNCTPCNTAGSHCLTCQVNQNNCTSCDIEQGFYFFNFTCITTCPHGTYSSLLDEYNHCLLCDNTPNYYCDTCINSSTICTNCSNKLPPNGPTVWLYNYQCISPCPDGYEANNVTYKCIQCQLGNYSYLGQCISWCPQYYTPDDNIRACVLSGGYPISMTVEVQGPQMLKFTIPLPLGLDNITFLQMRNITNINLFNSTNWNQFITLTYIQQSNSTFVTITGRLLTLSYYPYSQYLPIGNVLNISNVQISNNSIILYCNNVSPDVMINAVSFKATFYPNLPTDKNKMFYQITTGTLIFPTLTQQFFDLNLKPFFLIALFLGIICIFAIMMRIQYTYLQLVQYMHCLQLVGLTYYLIYPYVSNLNLYSFIKGFDYINFAFMWNIPAHLISPALSYYNLTSYSFAIGDMNWLRLIGSLLQLLIIILLTVLVISLFECSRPYTKFFLALTADLMIIKSLHCWFASLVMGGLNIRNYQKMLDIYQIFTHMLSYILITFLLYVGYRCHQVFKFPTLSTLFLAIFVMVQTVLSTAPLLICSLLIFISFVQFGVMYGIEFMKQNKQKYEKIVKVSQQVKTTSKLQPFNSQYHTFLLRSMRPLTALMISCVMMIPSPTFTIILLSLVYFILFLLILLDLYFYYKSKKFQIDQKVTPQMQFNNQTKQDLKQVQSQFKDNHSNNNNGITILDMCDIVDDQFVQNKFRKNNKSLSKQSTSQVYNYNQNKFHVKNFD